MGSKKALQSWGEYVHAALILYVACTVVFVPRKVVEPLPAYSNKCAYQLG